MKSYDDDDDEEDLAELFHQTGNVRDMEEDTSRPRPGHNSGQEEDEALEDLSLNDLMVEARKDLFKDLLKAVRGGYATPAEKNVLRQMLKDNGMVMGALPDDPTPGGQNGSPQKAPLPSFPDPDYNR